MRPGCWRGLALDAARCHPECWAGIGTQVAAGCCEEGPLADCWDEAFKFERCCLGTCWRGAADDAEQCHPECWASLPGLAQKCCADGPTATCWDQHFTFDNCCPGRSCEAGSAKRCVEQWLADPRYQSGHRCEQRFTVEVDWHRYADRLKRVQAEPRPGALRVCAPPSCTEWDVGCIATQGLPAAIQGWEQKVTVVYPLAQEVPPLPDVTGFLRGEARHAGSGEGPGGPCP